MRVLLLKTKFIIVNRLRKYIKIREEIKFFLKRLYSLVIWFSKYLTNINFENKEYLVFFSSLQQNDYKKNTAITSWLNLFYCFEYLLLVNTD